jgi:hypothetical protein
VSFVIIKSCIISRAFAKSTFLIEKMLSCLNVLKADQIVVLASVLKLSFDIDFNLTGVPKTSNFIGRRSDLDSLERQLAPREVRERRKICVIYGLGGIGKTQLAIEYARLHKDLYISFFWIDGRTKESLIQSLLRIALRLPKGRIADMDLQKIYSLEESRKAAQEVLR